MVAVARTASHASRGWPADGRASMQVCASPGGEALASRTCPARAVWRPGSPARTGGSCRRRFFRGVAGAAPAAPPPPAQAGAPSVSARAAPRRAAPSLTLAVRTEPLPSPPLPSPPLPPAPCAHGVRRGSSGWCGAPRRPAARARARISRWGQLHTKNSQFNAKSKMACDTPRTTEPSRPTRRTLEERMEGGTARGICHALAGWPELRSFVLCVLVRGWLGGVKLLANSESHLNQPMEPSYS